jgi:ankyrin repeat protein
MRWSFASVCAFSAAAFADPTAVDLPRCVHHPGVERSVYVGQGGGHITGKTGERIYIHRVHPQLCALFASDFCKASAYLISGDPVIVGIGPPCGDWTYIEYLPPKSRDHRPVVGWIENSSIDRAPLPEKPPRGPLGAPINSDPMMRAVWSGDVPEIRRLVAAGHDVNQSIPSPLDAHILSETPLLLAVLKDDLAATQALISLGARAYIDDARWKCGMLGASLRGNSKIVELLLKAGAKIDCEEYDHDGGTALIMAARGDASPATMQLLIRAGADVNTLNVEGESALMRAVENNYIDPAVVLLKSGADPNLMPKNQQNPSYIGSIALFKAIETYRWTFDPTLFQLLLDHGANPNSSFTYAPDEFGNAPVDSGETALADVSSAGYETLVRMLLEHGANPALARQDGALPAALALKAGHPKIAEVIDEYARGKN